LATDFFATFLDGAFFVEDFEAADFLAAVFFGAAFLAFVAVKGMVNSS
jgi:hypothetical protein